MDLTESIAPKSDQLNAEDLLSGPRTFTVADVKKGSDEQPVNIHLVEFPGRPFRPSKTVRRILVNAWGPEASAYAGRRMTLYRDPAVKFGGMDVGGIRVSHLSHIDKPLSVALTVSRGKRQPYTVQPLAAAPTNSGGGDAGEGTPPPASRFDVDSAWPDNDPTWKALQAGLKKWQTANDATRADVLLLVSSILDREVSSTNELTVHDARRVLDGLRAAS